MKTNKKMDTFLFLIVSVSLLATLGSLFLSEILRYVPCKLCWIQRIFMYPITIISLVAFLKRDYTQYLYILLLSFFGIGFALYHYLVQKTTFFQQNNLCVDLACQAQYINGLGFITIPFLSLISFLMMIVFSLFIYRLLKEKIK
ncbi:disulfide bond formation protein DsbB [Bacillus pakistanensis]|uniref:Disulfide bond formation protein DsbB n=1 Tax=Rossellomorea pakistanensis TaxID=992288 RepID=A0ABS2NIR6_9BACI|nr:disulfide oxidoreductase [Bacillus pakistanensis]MBM7587695.1 disulfide bond formation protein DsbB [Bacillus pakistanensis]